MVLHSPYDSRKGEANAYAYSTRPTWTETPYAMKCFGIVYNGITMMEHYALRVTEI